MNILKAMEVFVVVAEEGAFARAAKRLNMSAPTVTRHVADLEGWLGQAVFRRTTRSLTLTDAGHEFLDRCRAVVSETRAIRDSASAKLAEPSGLIKISASRAIAVKVLSGVIPNFIKEYPKVRLEMEVTDERVDLVAGGYDLAIRLGELADSSLTAKKLCSFTMVMFASPSFIDTHSAPKSLNDLGKFPCLTSSVGGAKRHWNIAGGLSVDGPVLANDGELLRRLALEDVGIGYLPSFYVQEDLAQGDLVPLLDDADYPSLNMYAVFPPKAQISNAARAFVDSLTTALST